MSKLPPMTAEEWEQTPITFGAETTARVMRCELRWVQNNAQALGGIKQAGKWLFSKATIAKLAGLQ